MAIAWSFTHGARTPVMGGTFPGKPEARIGWPLVAGSFLFGAGWGLVGLCPGPAMASISYGGLSGVVFLVAMVAGMLAAPPIRRRLDTVAPTA